MAEPIEVEDYLEQLLAGLQPLAAVQLPLADCLGLVTASTVTAEVAVPPFTNSAMDGFAVHAADIAPASEASAVVLQVLDDVPAGHHSDVWVGDGQATRIMTGALLPAGADAVVQVELTDQPAGAAELPSQVQVLHPVPEGANIRLAGEDLAEGAQVLDAGVRLTPAALAATAATGHGSLLVHPRPRVAIIATGAELVEPGGALDRGQIPDSNSLMLAALAKVAGAEVVSTKRCSDEPEDFDRAVAAALEVADLIVTSGGVSAGVRDVVKTSAIASQMHFVKVRMQPGKPQGYGHLTSSDGRAVPMLSLPGNPVSVFVSWHVFGVPLLGLLAGQDALRARRTAVAGASWTSPEGRRQHIPVAYDEAGRVVPCHQLGSGSHLIASLHLADALAIVAAEVDRVEVGDELELLPIGAER